MKTELMLLMITEGRPVMSLAEVGQMMALAERTIVNQIYAETFPMPAYKVGSKFVVDVRDFASYLDTQRAEARREFDAR